MIDGGFGSRLLDHALDAANRTSNSGNARIKMPSASGVTLVRSHEVSPPVSPDAALLINRATSGVAPIGRSSEADHGAPPASTSTRKHAVTVGGGSREVGVARNGKFVIKRGRGGKTHFVLLASNGRVVATSETYESKESCLKGIAAVKRLAADAPVIDDDEPATARPLSVRKTKAPAQ
jgi:uncharacterized protein YegP (UPF0339 family)